jgi:hypothetical protein
MRFTRHLPSLAAIIVGLASFSLSFVALRDVSVRLHAVPGYMGWLVPIVVDAGAVSGSAIIWAASFQPSARLRFPYAFVAALVAISVIINIAHAGPSVLAKGIAALSPLVLLGSLELVAGQHRRDATEPVPVSPVAVASGHPAEPSRAQDSLATEETLAAAPPAKPVRKRAAPGRRPAAAAPVNVASEPVAPVVALGQPRSAEAAAPAPANAPRARQAQRRPLRVSAESPTLV